MTNSSQDRGGINPLTCSRFANSERLKEQVLVLYVVGAFGFSLPVLRPLFIVLTPFCLLLTTLFLAWDFRINQQKRPTPGILLYLGGVYLVSLLVEMAGVHTGAIFGAYTYGRGLGFSVAGTPLLIGINWVLLVVASGALFSEVNNRALAALGAALAMVGYDVVMEQVCHHMEMWSWAGGNIPLRNYAAWFVLALLFHAGAVSMRIRFRSFLARWIFYVQLGFFIWLFIIFEHPQRLRLALGTLILISLLMRGVVSWLNYRKRPVLPPGTPERDATVSILIPARNEEKNIGNLLASLGRQNHAQVEIIVCDDQSTDATPAIVRDAIKSDSRISLIESPELPSGWLGKNHACHLLGTHARGDYLLFLDADVEIAPDFIASAMAYVQQHKLALLSLFPEQDMRSLGEWLTVPLMHRILLSLLPLQQVRCAPHPSLAAANGQCMFFDATLYRQLLPHKQVRTRRTEDIAIARLLKGQGERVACLLGNQMVFCRMYASYGPAVQGFARHVVEFFGGHYALALLYGVTSTTLLYPLIFWLQPWLAVSVVLANFAIAQLNARAANQHGGRVALFQLAQELAFWHILTRAITRHLRGAHKWKGRLV